MCAHSVQPRSQYWILFCLSVFLSVCLIYRHKLPYMKKTRKKKQVCGAACFIAAEIKFSKDVRLSNCRQHGFQSVTQVCFGISISNFICMLVVAMGRSLLISMMSLSKWPPGSHLRFFAVWTLNLVLALNIKSKLQYHITCVYGKEHIYFQQCHLKMAAWWPYWIL